MKGTDYNVALMVFFVPYILAGKFRNTPWRLTASELVD